jgi:hypothetical protein
LVGAKVLEHGLQVVWQRGAEFEPAPVARVHEDEARRVKKRALEVRQGAKISR